MDRLDITAKKSLLLSLGENPFLLFLEIVSYNWLMLFFFYFIIVEFFLNRQVQSYWHILLFFTHAKTKWIVVQNNNCDFHFAYLSLILVVKECHFDTHLSYIDRYIGDSFVIIFTAETHIYGLTVCVTVQYTWQMKGNPPVDGLSGLQVNKKTICFCTEQGFFHVDVQIMSGMQDQRINIEKQKTKIYTKTSFCGFHDFLTSGCYI